MNRKVISSNECFCTPEFKAFAKSIGIDLSKRFTKLEIYLEIESPVVYVMTAYGDQLSQEGQGDN